MEKIGIQTEYIKLQQLLKLSGIIMQGSDAKILIKENKIKVNGVIINQRGKKIYPEDIVDIEGIKQLKVEYMK